MKPTRVQRFRSEGPRSKHVLRRRLVRLSLLAVALVLPGCPIYPDDDDGCERDSDCGVGFLCDEPTGLCGRVPSCSEPADCARGETCGRAGVCETSDCSWEEIGCVRGYVCSAESGRWQCVAATGSEGAAGATAGPEGGAGPADGVGGNPAQGETAEGGSAGAI